MNISTFTLDYAPEDFGRYSTDLEFLADYLPEICAKREGYDMACLARDLNLPPKTLYRKLAGIGKNDFGDRYRTKLRQLLTPTEYLPLITYDLHSISHHLSEVEVINRKLAQLQGDRYIAQITIEFREGVSRAFLSEVAFLASYLPEVCVKRRNYNMSSLARDLGVSPSGLSNMLAENEEHDFGAKYRSKLKQVLTYEEFLPVVGYHVEATQRSYAQIMKLRQELAIAQARAQEIAGA